MSSAPKCKCGKTMIERTPTTPEQAACGTWHICPEVQASGYNAIGLNQHTVSVLDPSEEVRRIHADAGVPID